MDDGDLYSGGRRRAVRLVAGGWLAPVQGCSECEWLWLEYAEATICHIQARGKHRLAKLEGDPAKSEQLAADSRRAESVRAAARKAIQLHKSAAHEKTGLG
jgi:hypothetical protein